MTQYFSRDGVELKDSNVGLLRGGNIQVLWNTADGTTIQYLWDRPCSRCGGAGGADKWAHTGWKCFDCGGSGKHIHGAKKLKGYSAEKLEQLNATQAKRREKAAAKREADAAAAKRAAEAALAERLEDDALLRQIRDHADQDGILADFWTQVSERNRELTDRQREFARTLIERVRENAIKAKAKAEAEAAIERLNAEGGHVGSIGDRIEIDGVVEDVIAFRSHFTYSYGDSGERRIIKIRQGADLLVWFTSPCGIYKDHIGQPITGKGTVKNHDERDGVPQTVLTRCKLQLTEVAA